MAQPLNSLLIWTPDHPMGDRECQEICQAVTNANSAIEQLYYGELDLETALDIAEYNQVDMDDYVNILEENLNYLVGC
jgi:hypothetical protein